MKTLFLLGLLACSAGPTVESVQPSKAEVGSKVTVFGTGFTEDTLILLETATGERVRMDDLEPSGTVAMKGRVPLTLSTAEYRIVVQRDGRDTVTERVLSVTVPPPDEPCAENYTANTQVSWVRKVIVVDRFYKDGTREVLRTPFDEVEKVEVEAHPHGEKTCSVVYIRKTDGSRMRYAESLKEDLSGRAYKFANEMQKPVIQIR